MNDFQEAQVTPAPLIRKPPANALGYKVNVNGTIFSDQGAAWIGVVVRGDRHRVVAA